MINHFPVRHLVYCGACLAALVCYQPSCLAQRPLVRLTVRGTSVEGTPAAWSDHQLMLLGRDGMLSTIAANDVQQYTVVSSNFRPMTQREMRGLLLREFGRSFEVSGTGTYLVVHPTGQHDVWAPRFEQLYRAFSHHFSVRGLQIAHPEFPLVAVAFGSREQFVQYAQSLGIKLPPGVVGFYSMLTNRILLYDVTAGNESHTHLNKNVATILHEATHQIAFNSGVHSRLASPPRWLAEGLAMMFEAPGIWDPVHHPQLADRVNWSRFSAYLRLSRSARQSHPPIPLEQLITDSDELFAANPEAAYAESWAFSFFLSEKEPTRYVKYLALTATRRPFRRYRPADQRREFASVFGTNLPLLEARFVRFTQELRNLHGK